MKNRYMIVELGEEEGETFIYKEHPGLYPDLASVTEAANEIVVGKLKDKEECTVAIFTMDIILKGTLVSKITLHTLIDEDQDDSA